MKKVYKKVFEKNDYGINIVKCCASCRLCKLDNSTRLCTIDRRSVPSSYLCPNWKMKESLYMAGKGDGKVKKRKYLLYAIDKLTDDDMAALAASSKMLAYKRLTISEIRSEYEKQDGEIYSLL